MPGCFFVDLVEIFPQICILCIFVGVDVALVCVKVVKPYL